MNNQEKIKPKKILLKTKKELVIFDSLNIHLDKSMILYNNKICLKNPVDNLVRPDKLLREIAGWAGGPWPDLWRSKI